MSFNFSSPTTTAPPAFGTATQSSSFNFNAGDSGSKPTFNFGTSAAATKPGSFNFSTPAAATTAGSLFNISATSPPNLQFGSPNTPIQSSLLLGSSPAATTSASSQFQLGGGTGLFASGSSPSTGLNFGGSNAAPVSTAQPLLGFGTPAPQPQHTFGLGATTAAPTLPNFSIATAATTQATSTGFSFGPPAGGLPGFGTVAPKPVAAQTSSGLNFGTGLPAFGTPLAPSVPTTTIPTPALSLGQSTAPATSAGLQFGPTVSSTGSGLLFGQTASTFPMPKPVSILPTTQVQPLASVQSPQFGISTMSSAKPQLPAPIATTASLPTFGLPTSQPAKLPSFGFPTAATSSTATGFQLGSTTPATITNLQLGTTSKAPGTTFQLGSTASPAASLQLGTPSTISAPSVPASTVPSSTLPATAFQLGGATAIPSAAFGVATTTSGGSLKPVVATTQPATFTLAGVTSVSSSIGGTVPSAVTTTSMTDTTGASGGLGRGFPLPTTSGISLPGLTLLTTSTVTTAATPQPPSIISSMNFAQLEEMINKWTLDLEEQEKVFINQATQVNAWDRLLIANGEKIVQLNDAIQNVQAEQHNLDHELDFVLAQQKELEELLVPLEKELANVTVADPEREQMYNMAENIDTQLKYMSEDLKEVIDHLNESNRNQDSNDPIVQISRILNAHMSSMQWIDSSTAQISAKLDHLTAMKNALRRDNERTFHLTYN